MFRSIQQHRDYYAGGLLVLIGAGTIVQSLQYDLGTLAMVGPGAFPLAMGFILVLCGIAIGFSARNGLSDDGEDHSGMEHPEWRGWFCIVAGFISFIVLAKTTGSFPATFACVFISALGDRLMTLRNALLLALIISIFGVVVFYYGLHVPLPPFAW